ncbi:MAG TPA: Uma2 family endonuclease [Thermoanaerobaculia bacterium]|nr:Uma2 family endonuclease [Thermoanaerobaculia bacterium]
MIGEATAGRLELLPLSVEQYDRMIEEGILPEDTGVELLDGVMVRKDRGDAGGDPMTVGEAHAYVVKQLAYLGLRLDPTRLHLQTQQPIVIPGAGEPEPDAAIVVRPITAIGKPHAADVSCVIEVAGTSIERDRTTKLRHYARGGIPQYVILNLQDWSAEEYLEPEPAPGTYASRRVSSSSGSLDLRLDGETRLQVAVGGLFPAR